MAGPAQLVLDVKSLSLTGGLMAEMVEKVVRSV